MNSKGQYRGRLAPTPSGLLHMGHAQTFLIAWRRARERKGKLVLRIEDIDSARCRKEFIDAAIRDMKSVGLDWDEGPDIGGKFAPYAQSLRTDYYWEILRELSKKNLVYPCSASRARIKKLSPRPQADGEYADTEPLFPKELRGSARDADKVEGARNLNWRFIVPDGRTVSFDDGNMGGQNFEAGKDFGDFLVWRKSGEPSYELAVAADDIAMEITEVVRGADLLISTARQILIYEALGRKIPAFFHCPLLRGKDGEKISKSSPESSEKNGWLICRQKGLL